MRRDGSKLSSECSRTVPEASWLAPGMSKCESRMSWAHPRCALDGFRPVLAALQNAREPLAFQAHLRGIWAWFDSFQGHSGSLQKRAFFLFSRCILLQFGPLFGHSMWTNSQKNCSYKTCKQQKKDLCVLYVRLCLNTQKKPAVCHYDRATSFNLAFPIQN